jgi:hypothetical protein
MCWQVAGNGRGIVDLPRVLVSRGEHGGSEQGERPAGERHGSKRAYPAVISSCRESWHPSPGPTWTWSAVGGSGAAVLRGANDGRPGNRQHLKPPVNDPFGTQQGALLPAGRFLSGDRNSTSPRRTLGRGSSASSFASTGWLWGLLLSPDRSAAVGACRRELAATS